MGAPTFTLGAIGARWYPLTMNRTLTVVLAASALVAGCAPPPQADPEFSDAARFAFREFDTEEPADLAFAIRALETVVLADMDLEAESAADRWVAPEFLTDEDVAGIDHPDYPVNEGLPVAVGKISQFPVSAHPEYLALADQTPVEPGGPQYDRTFLEGSDACWPSNDCEWMRTENHLIKQNFLLRVEYDLFKDYRWVDLNLPAPSTVPEGEPIVNEGEPRWAIAARSWTDQVWVGEEGENEIQLSFSFEVWIPQDDGTTTRLLALWSRTNLNDGNEDATIQNVIRGGIENIFVAQEEYLVGDE